MKKNNRKSGNICKPSALMQDPQCILGDGQIASLDPMNGLRRLHEEDGRMALGRGDLLYRSGCAYGYGHGLEPIDADRDITESTLGA